MASGYMTDLKFHTSDTAKDQKKLSSCVGGLHCRRSQGLRDRCVKPASLLRRHCTNSHKSQTARTFTALLMIDGDREDCVLPLPAKQWDILYTAAIGVARGGPAGLAPH